MRSLVCWELFKNNKQHFCLPSLNGALLKFVQLIFNFFEFRINHLHINLKFFSFRMIYLYHSYVIDILHSISVTYYWFRRPQSGLLVLSVPYIFLFGDKLQNSSITSWKKKRFLCILLTGIFIIALNNF